jgi:hypothetical protein
MVLQLEMNKMYISMVYMSLYTDIHSHPHKYNVTFSLHISRLYTVLKNIQQQNAIWVLMKNVCSIEQMKITELTFLTPAGHAGLSQELAW